MRRIGYRRARAVILCVLLALVAWAQAGSAQTPTVVGQATAMRATTGGLLGPVTTALASTGGLTGEADAREASALTGSLLTLGSAEVLHSAAVSSIFGWHPLDRVSSEASLANLALSVGGNRISADFVMAEATATVQGTREGLTRMQGLALNGSPVLSDGTENQRVSAAGVTLVLNQVARSAGTISVTALRIISSDGLVDVAVASATAGIRQ